MTVARDVIRSFARGEQTPKLGARDDLDQWRISLKRCRNMIIMPYGGATSRMGTVMMGAVKDAAAPPVILPFVFAETPNQSYMMELGENYIRWYTRAGRVVDESDDPYEIASPWSAAQARALHFVQSNDLAWYTHADVQPRRLERRDHADWQLVEVDFVDGPYEDENTDDALTVTSSGTSGSVTLTASAALFDAGRDVGRLMRLYIGDTWGYGEITAVASSTSATLLVKRSLGGTGATAAFRLGMFSPGLGWPGLCSFFESRLCVAGMRRRPQTVCLSKSGDFENFSETSEIPDGADAGKIKNEVVADDALVYTIDANSVDKIVGLQEGDRLLILTVSALRQLSAQSSEEGLTPDNPKQRRAGKVGCASVRPIETEEGAYLIVGAYGKRIFDLVYSIERDGMVPDDKSILSEHLFRAGVASMAWQANPYQVAWFALKNGRLVSCTYNRAQQIVAFARHELAGTDARVLSVAVLPGEEQDDLWLVVSRTINDETRVFIERMAPQFEADPEDAAQKSGMWFVDAGLRGVYEDPQDVISGLEHLEGETVKIVADGALQPDRVVTDGTITLQTPARDVVVGLGYRQELITPGIAAQAIPGYTAEGQKQSVKGALVKLLGSLGGAAGEERGTLQPFNTWEASYPADDTQPLFTGEITVSADGNYEAGGRFRVVSDDPLPLTVLGIELRFESVEV